MSFGCWWVDRSNDIHAPHFKRPRLSCWVKRSRCLMYEVTVDLTGMASSCISDGICDHLWPIIAKSSKPVPKFGPWLVSSTSAFVGLFECLMHFSLRKTSQQNSIIQFPIQCSGDRIVVESWRLPLNCRCLFRVIEENAI